VPDYKYKTKLVTLSHKLGEEYSTQPILEKAIEEELYQWDLFSHSFNSHLTAVDGLSASYQEHWLVFRKTTA
tara:strand:- start:322 stop:537 length:216 start_codon:yes stop_codon:yes gene_type:complete